MNERFVSYEFAGLRLFPESLQIEVSESGKKINLSPTHCRFLLVLMQNPRRVVSYDELRKNVWTQTKELDQSLKRLIQTTKGDIIKVFKQIGIDEKLIVNVPGQGYRLNADVEFAAAHDTYSERIENSDITDEAFSKEKIFSFSHTAFSVTVGFFYGLLYATGLVLETAYRFDELREAITGLFILLLLLNASTMYLSLYVTEKIFIDDRSFPLSFITKNGLFTGIALLCVGAFFSCWIGSSFLPNEPVTAAAFQTQPASAAYVKNALVYFLPLGVFLILLPFYAICGKSAGKKVFTVPPAMLLGAWFLMLVYSILSTFYLFDNLLPSPFRNFFVITAIFRFVIYFGLGLGVILYYFSKIKIQPVENSNNRQTAILVGLATIGFSFYYVHQRDEKVPELYSVEIKTPRNAENRLFVNLKGKRFDPDKLQIRVVGGECPAASPCAVPNGALKKHSVIMTETVENVPLTLPAGEFYIYAQNGGTKMSGSILLSVP